MLNKTQSKTNRRGLAAMSAVFAASLALTSCGSGGGDAEKLDNGDQQQITIGLVDGWAEGVAVTYLWQQELEDEGYDVKIKKLDVAVIYQALASGEIDVYMDTPLPVTHKDYVDKHGDDIVDLGVWFENMQNAITVNEDSPAKSISDLKSMGDEYGHKLVGTEPGAGLTKVTKKTIKAYGLEDYDFVTSSTPAMLTELKKALKTKQNIAVTLWHPHWAYSVYPVRDLKDPKGTMGEPDHTHMYGKQDFKQDFPDLAKRFDDFQMDEDEVGEVLKEMYVGKDADEQKGVEAWMKKNPDFVDKM